ncbi:MAG: DUF202 domain-containing protein [Streptococcus sp.]|nr:DUF202 domain-containing protein [Streptococcus sp.]
MLQEDTIKGYETEIQYQKHMIENLGRWLTLMFIISSVGGLLIYSFKDSNLLLFILGIFLASIGFLAMLIFGYGIYKGRINLMRVIQDFKLKLEVKNNN